jgi:hypothetical protein
MARYQVRDLTKVKQTETINLKNNPEKQDSSLKSKSSGKNQLNLRAFHKSSGKKLTQVHSNPPSRHLDSLSGNAAPQKYNLVPRERPAPPYSTSRFQHPARLAVSGLLVVFIINLFNVFTGSQQFKSTLISSASSGFDNILAGVDQTKRLSHSEAQTDFQQAQGNFNQALEKISFLRTSNVFSQQSSVASLENLLSAGKSISEAGQLFSQSAGNLQEWPTLFIQANRQLSLAKTNPQIPLPDSLDQPNPSAALTAPSLTDKLKTDLSNVEQAINKVSDAKNFLDQVHPGLLPENYRAEIPEIKTRLAKLETFLKDLSTHFPAILELLGDRYPHRYLILLQNDTEARPTGGFIGSLMILDINDGVVTKSEFHDVYQYDGQLNQDIEAPEEIAQITDNWRLRDSNYSPDFAISAEKAAWFLQKSKGPSVDTVIAINQSAIGEMLAELGPIRVDPLKADLDANNFQMILGFLIESKYFGADNPKKILAKTIEAFKNKVLASPDPSLLLNTMIKLIKDQKILFYSRDAKIQSLFEKFQLTPHQLPLEAGEDYLQVIATSIGGNKSDLYMTQNLTHTTFVDSDGTVHDELNISRKHNWTGAELHRYETILQKFGFDGMPENLQNILGKGDNKAAIKVYLPLGAELENTVGVDQKDVMIRHDADLQKTALLLQMNVPAGEERFITLRYKLPQKLTLTPAALYRFSAQNQLTLVPTQFKKVLQLSPALTLLKTNRQDTATATSSEEVLNLRDSYQLRAVVAK